MSDTLCVMFAHNSVWRLMDLRANVILSQTTSIDTVTHWLKSDMVTLDHMSRREYHHQAREASKPRLRVIKPA